MSIMKLPCDRQVLDALTFGETIAAIWVRRQALRWSRDQRGDDRCWLDDYRIWSFVSEIVFVPPWRPPMDVAMVICRQFYERRRADDVETYPPGAILDPDHWDDDLWLGGIWHIREQLALTQIGILKHWESPFGIEADRALYHILPEKIPADFRLPPEEEFLGEARAPHAGCPSFWRSHEGCEVRQCRWDRWGLCS